MLIFTGVGSYGEQRLRISGSDFVSDSSVGQVGVGRFQLYDRCVGRGVFFDMWIVNGRLSQRNVIIDVSDFDINLRNNNILIIM